MTKLVVMIPCLNEQETLPLVLGSIPKKISGIDTIETMIIDDGSTDATIQVAQKHNVTKIIIHQKTRGLAKSFVDGLDAALLMGADVIVNTDGDNQYPQGDIGKLVWPILNGRADIVIADRQTAKIAHFSPLKKLMQYIGSSVVCNLAGIYVPDAVSGFRAYSRAAAMELNVVTEFSYATETIIQAGKIGLKVQSVPVITNPKTRESRLFKNMAQHIKMTGSTMVRVFAMFEPLKTFFHLGTIFILIGTFFLARFGYFYLLGNGSGHLQSIVFGSIMFLAGFQIWVLGLVSDLIAGNRKLIEQVLLNQKREKYAKFEK
ncbi:MAG: glycosyltransferase family 2 protein [bacterium]